VFVETEFTFDILHLF